MTEEMKDSDDLPLGFVGDFESKLAEMKDNPNEEGWRDVALMPVVAGCLPVN